VAEPDRPVEPKAIQTRSDADSRTAQTAVGTERRSVERKRPAGISYFEFAAGSGGIVVDASEKGLGFQSAIAVHQLGPRRICISPHPAERIELNGDVVWMDKSKKAGGLRFTAPSADGCNRIRNWLKQSGESDSSRHSREYPLPARAVEEACAPPGTNSHPQEGKKASPTVAPPPRLAAREPRPVGSPFASVVPPLFSPDASGPSQDSRRTGGFVRSVATGFLLGVMVLAPVVLFENFGLLENFRPKVGNALIRLGEELSGKRDWQPESSTPPQGSVQGPAQTPAATKPIPNAPAQDSQENSAPPHAYAQDSASAAGPAIPRPRQTAREPSYGRAPTPDRSAEVMRLWSAVGAGDSSAEVDLARLYLKGEGVARNCEQARILLRAAVKNGSRQARRQLQKLRRSGCW
jgi:hypothetical protein